jgi:hypothetical protein
MLGYNGDLGKTTAMREKIIIWEATQIIRGKIMGVVCVCLAWVWGIPGADFSKPNEPLKNNPWVCPRMYVNVNVHVLVF